MYLRQLHTHHRLLSAFAIIFICGQLFVILIWGIVITPFYNYGMYSEVIEIKKNYEVFEVEVNGKRLRGEDFSPQEWDKIILPVQFYAAINKSNELYNTEIKRLLDKMHISVNDQNFLLSCQYQQFENWYKDYLQSITKQKAASLTIHYRNYKYDLNKLVPTTSSLPLSQLCR